MIILYNINSNKNLSIVITSCRWSVDYCPPESNGEGGDAYRVHEYTKLAFVVHPPGRQEGRWPFLNTIWCLCVHRIPHERRRRQTMRAFYLIYWTISTQTDAHERVFHGQQQTSRMIRRGHQENSQFTTRLIKCANAIKEAIILCPRFWLPKSCQRSDLLLLPSSSANSSPLEKNAEKTHPPNRKPGKLARML